MQTRKDVATALGLSDKTLCFFLYSGTPRKSYRHFDIPKRSGGVRTISAPPSSILQLQRSALRALLKYYKPKACVHGFVENRGILSNARPHAGRRLIVNFDLREFFPSIHFGRVKGVLTSRPFQFGDEAAMVLAQIACQHSGELPQGGALSPFFSNLVCRGLDNELLIFAKNHKLLYTRYADDMTFSTSRPFFPPQLLCLDPLTPGPSLNEIVARHSFAINPKKIKYRSRQSRQEVTGLTVNEFPNLRRDFVRDLTGALSAWQKHGYADAQKRYEAKFKCNGGNDLHNVVRGRIAYLKMVRGSNDFIYRRIVRQFNRMVAKPIPINTITTAEPSPLHNLTCPWSKWFEKYTSEVFLLTCKMENFELDRGTAFHIGGGKLASARHCIYDRHGEVRSHIRVDVDGSEVQPVAINPDLQVHQTVDIAALHVSSLESRRGIPTQLRLPQIGEEVAAIGFPNLAFRSKSLVLHVGIVEALPTDATGRERFIQVGFVSGGGMSGGCLIDKAGFLLGIVVGNISEGSILPYLPIDEKNENANDVDNQEQDADKETEDTPIPKNNEHKLRPPRPYGQAVPVEYLDSFIHGENLAPAQEHHSDETVFEGVPPKWYLEQQMLKQGD